MIRQNALLNETSDRDDVMNKSFKLIYPQRVWFKDNTNSYCISDYCFPNEGEKEMIENLKSIWGQNLEVSIDEISTETIKEEKEDKTTLKEEKGKQILLR